jgi:hypothetical protein
MATKKNIDTKFGFSLEGYGRIVSVQFNRREKCAHVYREWYPDKAASDAGAPPLEVEDFFFWGEAWPGFAAALGEKDLVKQCYLLIAAREIAEEKDPGIEI